MEQQLIQTSVTSSRNGTTLLSDHIDTLLTALQSPKFVWRTMQGLVADTSLPEPEVEHLLHQLSPDVLVTTVGPKGRLYTTRDHYSKKQSAWGRILSAVTGELK